MNYVPVSSSNIAAIAYDDEGRILGVRFRTGREYWYHGVAFSVYQAFLAASSKGRFLISFVKPRYRCTRA